MEVLLIFCRFPGLPYPSSVAFLPSRVAPILCHLPHFPHMEDSLAGRTLSSSANAISQRVANEIAQNLANATSQSVANGGTQNRVANEIVQDLGSCK